jgi:hypothetical protein
LFFASLGISLIGAAANAFNEHPATTSIVATLVLIAGAAIVTWRSRLKAAKAQALAEAAAAEQQRQLAEQERQRQERWKSLCDRYGEENAAKIWSGNLWLGCTTDMMLEILGQPLAVDEKVLKTKTKHTYKYRPTGVNRYALRVFVENSQVIGWEDKADD